MRSSLLALALLATACAPTPAATPAPAEAPAQAEAPAAPALAHAPRSAEAAKAAGVDFRAVGQEPGWVLEVGQEIDLIYDYGQQHFRGAAAVPTYPHEGTTVWAAREGEHQILVTIQRYPCQDAMSGENYPTKVSVMIDGRLLEGCGRTL